MTLQELLDLLASVDLSNTSLVENQAITPVDQGKVINAIQDGLTQLHTRFTLSFRDVWVQTYKHITYYHLDPLYAESNADHSSARELYIKDLPGEKFEGGVLKIISAYNERGHQLPLNDREDPRSIFTPQPTILQIPRLQEQGLINCVYQANHAKLTTTDLDQQRVEIPEVLVAALCAYVGYRMYGPINTQEAILKSATFKQTFDNLCDEAAIAGVVNTDTNTTNSRFQRNGWI